MMHEYSANDITACLRSQKIVFVGDSTARDIFWAAAKRLDSRAAVEQEAVAQKHQSQTFSHPDVDIEFVWDPYLNSTDLNEQLLAYRNAWEWVGGDTAISKSPAIILIGGGLWHMRHLGEAFLTEYMASMEKVISHEAPESSSRSGSLLDSRRTEMAHSNNLMVIAPVQHLAYESLSPSVKESVTPDKVNELNQYLLNVSSSNQASVAFSYQSMTSASEFALKADGVHVTEQIVYRELDVLLNLRCNARLLRLERYPTDKTCCGPYASPSWVQTVLVTSSLGILLSTILLFIYGAQPSLTCRVERLRCIQILNGAHFCQHRRSWLKFPPWRCFFPILFTQIAQDCLTKSTRITIRKILLSYA